MFWSAIIAFTVFATTNAFVHNVQVSDHNGNLVYTPPVTTAKPGDFVNFIFSPKNHTVTQSSFDDPCTPLSNGFNSGFRPVAANLTSDFPVFTIPVLDSKPIWFHCEQGAGTNASHCGKGMVGAINPSADKTFDALKYKALASLSNSTSNSSNTHYSNTPHNHSVTVSNDNGTLAFFPPITNANPGDFVIFNFFPKNHTVTQSSFDDPCSPVQHGFNSGFQPVSSTYSPLPQFIVSVNDTNPIWFYCQQGANTNASHCGKGMVGAINTDQSKFDQFKQKALVIGASLGSNSTSAPTVHQVSVSNADGNLTYTPPVTYAKPGEVVRFTFFPKNHTVSQSSFDDPCSPLDYGFTSGFHPVVPGTTSYETFDVTVKDDKPIWFYCQQGANTNASHCGKGMVGAINPTADKTFDEFQQKALAIGAALSANATSAPTVHQVSVSNANGSLTYTPEVTYAKPGEIVRFTFFPKNHTVSQSSFDSPCSPLDYGSTSGFRPVTPGAASSETFDIVVKDDKPIWFYCQQGANTNATHCGKGMVGAINPTADKTFTEFQQKALAVGTALGANAPAAPTYHDVTVGGQDGSLVYVPSVVSAKPGDFVRFTFNPKNHTVTQSSFDQPCTRIQDGIDSGFHPIAPNSYGAHPVFTIPVTDYQPKWFYCAQGAGTNASHCGQGMVFALNPTDDKTFAAFHSKALAFGASLGTHAPYVL